MSKRVTAEGKRMGNGMRLISEAGRLILEHQNDKPKPCCKSCAFRQGTVANGCLQTQMDIMKALKETVPFMCHSLSNEGEYCHGYMSAAVYMLKNPKFLKQLPPTDYPFSEPD